MEGRALANGNAHFEVLDCTFTFGCPKKWENLKETDANDVRHCNVCEQNVYQAVSKAELDAHVEANHRVAVLQERSVGPVVALVGYDYSDQSEDLPSSRIPLYDEPSDMPVCQNCNAPVQLSQLSTSQLRNLVQTGLCATCAASRKARR